MHSTSNIRPVVFILTLLSVAVAGGHGVRAQGPAAVAQQFARGWENGTAASVTGQVSVFQTDDAAGNSGMTQSIRDERTGEWFVLRFESGFPRLRSGARIRITGRTAGSEMYVAGCCDGAITNVEVLSQPSTAVSGDQRALVMIGDLSDAAVPCTTEEVRNTLFAPAPATLDEYGSGLSINAEHQASSYGRVTWSGQVTRTTLNIRTTDACDLAQYSAMLDARAAASGIDVASFPRKLYVFPQIAACPFIGASTVGSTPSSSFSLSCTNRGLYSHELGHALGMGHAASYYDAYTAGSGDFNNLLAEYNDYSDSMGASGRELRGFNAPHREQMGWLTQDATQIVTQSGRYNLAPLSIDPASATAPQLIKIPRAEGGFYYLSYRGGQGFDRYSPSYIPQVSVHRHGAPTEAVSGFTVLYTTLANGQTGRDTFSDPVNGITVRILSGYGPTPGPGAVVDIDIQQACVRTAPALQITPQNQSGAAGGSPSYAISITNRDATNCPAATFALSDIVPAGWSGSLSSDTLTLTPGANGQAVLTVTSAASSAAGTYTTRVNTNGAASIVHAASTDATYTVVDGVAPSQPLTLTATAINKSKQIKLTWRPSTDNVGVSFYLISRNGVTVGTTTATEWNDSAWTAGATYAYVVRAVDAAGNTSQSSNTATIALSGGGGGKRR